MIIRPFDLLWQPDLIKDLKPFGVQITNAPINGFIHLEMFAVKRIMSSIIIIKYGIMQKPHA